MHFREEKSLHAERRTAVERDRTQTRNKVPADVDFIADECQWPNQWPDAFGEPLVEEYPESRWSGWRCHARPAGRSQLPKLPCDLTLRLPVHDPIDCRGPDRATPKTI